MEVSLQSKLERILSSFSPEVKAWLPLVRFGRFLFLTRPTAVSGIGHPQLKGPLPKKGGASRHGGTSCPYKGFAGVFYFPD